MRQYIKITILHNSREYKLHILQTTDVRGDFITYKVLESSMASELRLPWGMEIYQVKKTQEIQLDYNCRKVYQIALTLKIFEAIQQELRKIGKEPLVECQVTLSSSIPTVTQIKGNSERRSTIICNLYKNPLYVLRQLPKKDS
ncbi:hypothetical protein [Chryseobacterium sp. 22543]|uniref:hypothetical protein n=1 Tax=Chryseobacterium sp. 22543 TaxID=3453940 RepID=UPI003F84A490